MNHDAADLAMFWVGALFAFTPLVFFGVVIGVWWFQQKRKSGARGAGQHRGAGQDEGSPTSPGRLTPKSGDAR